MNIWRCCQLPFIHVDNMRPTRNKIITMVCIIMYIFIKLTETRCLLLNQCGCINIDTIDWLFNIVYGWIGWIRATHDSVMYKVEFRTVQAIRSSLLHCNRLHPSPLSKSCASLCILFTCIVTKDMLCMFNVN